MDLFLHPALAEMWQSLLKVSFSLSAKNLTSRRNQTGNKKAPNQTIERFNVVNF
jgi:hypothetical protein